MSEHVLISIKPNFANLILDGKKKIELRRKIPVNLKPGSFAVVYSTSPQKEIIGAFTVKNIIHADINQLWELTKKYNYVDFDDFIDYFNGIDFGYGIEIKETWRFRKPIDLEYLRRKADNFVIPQSYRYLSNKDSILINKEFFKEFSLQFAF